MKIIDSQLHCFYPNTPQRPWPEGATPVHGPEYTVEQVTALFDQHGVQGGVLVPPSWNGWDNRDFNRWDRRWRPSRSAGAWRADHRLSR